MGNRDAYLKMTGDDLRAARVLTLAVKFFGTSQPIPSSTIRSELYPDLDTGSFNRQFLRDRELLASFGLVICDADDNGGDTLWKVDEAVSYVQGEGLGAKEARMLYVLCHDMAFDQSFPYRDELRLALAKISRMYRGSAIPHSDATTPTQHKLLAALVSCMSNHHATDITYTDALGAQSERTIAILGSFGLRGNTYFVASRINKDGSLVDNSVRIYRLDRFDKVRELQKVRYAIPDDFNVSDYERLPFQIGDPCGVARFTLDSSVDRDVQRASQTHGACHQQDGRTIWEVSYSDIDAMASWAIATGLTPLAPPELEGAWTQTLRASAQASTYDASLDGTDLEAQVIHPRKRAGRTGSVTVTRQLVALATSLTREGEVITTDNIATTLGVSYDDARHLIALVSMGSGESIDYLPVILGDEDEDVALMEGAQMSARRVRLTRSETIALTAALSELGVDEDDPLFATLKSCYASPSFSLEQIARSLEEPSSTSDGAALRICSQAITENEGLTFSYHPVTGGDPSNRTVVPQRMRRSDDCWYLDAFDLARNADRTFRLDRMSDLHAIDIDLPKAPANGKENEQPIVVRFLDSRYLDLFLWDGLQLLSQDDDGVTVMIPYYGGTWLIRHLAACGNGIRLGDAQMAQWVQQYAQQQLD